LRKEEITRLSWPDLNKNFNFVFIKRNSMASNSSKKGKGGNNIIIVDNMRDYSNDPVFKKKLEDAKEFLKKHPIPDRLKKRK